MEIRRAMKINLTLIVAFILMWIIAPYYHVYIGRIDEAAWVQAFMFPTLFMGIIIGSISIFARKRWLLYVMYLMLAMHIIIGIGFHPR